MIIEAIAGTTAAIAGAKKLFDELMPLLERTCFCEFHNQTELVLTKVGDGNSHGGFKEPPAGTVKGGDTDMFSATSTGFATGAEGFVVWETQDATGKLFIRVGWDNPELGSNSCSARVYRVFPAQNQAELAKSPNAGLVGIALLGLAGLTADAPEYVIEASCNSGNHNSAKYLFRRR